MSEAADVVLSAPGQYSFSGDITYQTSPHLLRQLGRFGAEGGSLVIDFGQVGRIDSSCVALMLECLRQAQRDGTDLRFTSLPKMLADLIELFQLTNRLPIQQN